MNTTTTNPKMVEAVTKSLFGDMTYEQRIEEMLNCAIDKYDEEERRFLKEILLEKVFVPASPILRNYGRPNSNKHMSISCFVTEVEDNLEHIMNSLNKCMNISAVGGGLGVYWGKVRERGAKIRGSDTSSGIMPFLNIQSSIASAISQGSSRSGSSAAFLDIDHPEIMEFISMRKQSGGDPNLKAKNIHHGVIITDEFMEAVKSDSDFELKTRGLDKTKKYPLIKARMIWEHLLETRIETGEPYIIFIDNANNNRCEHYVKHNLKVTTSNLCTEIFSHTTGDKYAICCLGSINLANLRYKHMNDSMIFCKLILKFMNNVWEDFFAASEFHEHLSIKDRKEFRKHKDIGIGFMGYYDALNLLLDVVYDKKTGIVQEDRGFAKGNYTKTIISLSADLRRLSGGMNVTAIAPTATISNFADCSAGIEPRIDTKYMFKSSIGNFEIKSPEKHNESKSIYDMSQSDLLKDVGLFQEFSISQGISTNLYYKTGESRQLISDDHILAWELKLKSLYYLRTTSANVTKSCSIENDCESCQ